MFYKLNHFSARLTFFILLRSFAYVFPILVCLLFSFSFACFRFPFEQSSSVGMGHQMYYAVTSSTLTYVKSLVSFLSSFLSLDSSPFPLPSFICCIYWIVCSILMRFVHYVQAQNRERDLSACPHDSLPHHSTTYIAVGDTKVWLPVSYSAWRQREMQMLLGLLPQKHPMRNPGK